MKCPKCKKGDVKGDVFFKDMILSKKAERISKYYCPRCSFETEFRLDMDWHDYYSMISEKKEGFEEADSDIKFSGILIKPIKKQ